MQWQHTDLGGFKRTFAFCTCGMVFHTRNTTLFETMDAGDATRRARDSLTSLARDRQSVTCVLQVCVSIHARAARDRQSVTCVPQVCVSIHARARRATEFDRAEIDANW